MSTAREPGPAVLVAPAAKRLAHEHGIDLALLTGTGPRGRIVRVDVEQAIARHSSNAQPAAAAPQGRSEEGAAGGPGTRAQPSPSATIDREGSGGETQRIELTRIQRTIARRMTNAKATVPEFTLTCSVDMRRCVDLRAELKAASAPGAIVPSFNDMIVRACALALREHPRANGSYRDDGFELHSRVNVGVAVAAGDALLVPTVFDADRRSLQEIADETRRLAERARSASVTAAELGGGTFTISNLGMLGVSSFQAVINPPQAAILAVGSIEQRVVAADEAVAIRPIVDLTLTCDHRILYGADGAAFLASVRERLAAPSTLA